MMAKPMTFLWPKSPGTADFALVRFVPLLALYAALGGPLVDHVFRIFGLSEPIDCSPPSTGGVVVGFLISPVIETAVQALLLELSLRRGHRPAIAIFVSAAAMAALHSLLRPLWGVIVLWSFILFSYAYVSLRSRSRLTAAAATSCIHGLSNFFISLLATLLWCLG